MVVVLVVGASSLYGLDGGDTSRDVTKELRGLGVDHEIVMIDNKPILRLRVFNQGSEVLAINTLAFRKPEVSFSLAGAGVNEWGKAYGGVSIDGESALTAERTRATLQSTLLLKIAPGEAFLVEYSVDRLMSQLSKTLEDGSNSDESIATLAKADSTFKMLRNFQFQLPKLLLLPASNGSQLKHGSIILKVSD